MPSETKQRTICAAQGCNKEIPLIANNGLTRRWCSRACQARAYRVRKKAELMERQNGR
jgi:hypothetical protein